MSDEPTPFVKGLTSDKISSIFRRVDKLRASAKEARDRDSWKDIKHRCMLAGKVKAYVDVLCLIHDVYPEHLEPGLWVGAKQWKWEGNEPPTDAGTIPQAGESD